LVPSTSLPPSIIAALQLAASTSTSKLRVGKEVQTPTPPTARPAVNSRFPKLARGRAPLSESRTENLEQQPTPIRSLEDVITAPTPRIRPGTSGNINITTNNDKIKSIKRTKIVKKNKRKFNENENENEDENEPDSTTPKTKKLKSGKATLHPEPRQAKSDRAKVKASKVKVKTKA
jgi:hypothetical protein